MTIDWSKAPEGYDFHLIGKTKVSEGKFYRAQSDRFRSEAGGYVLYTDLRENLFVITSRPLSPEWNGESLPPVGTVCEWQAAGYALWIKVEIVFASSWVILVRDQNPHPDGSVDIAIDLTRAVEDKFRPIRTAKQIAAEERKNSIYEMAGHSHVGRSGFAMDMCAALYDAGYRKCP